MNLKNLRLSTGFVVFAALAALPYSSWGDTYVLRRDNVIPVVFESSLTIRDSRPGDYFAVKVKDSNQLPAGTRMEGRIDRIHPAHGNRPASMDLRFTHILLPDESQVVLDASPIPLDNKYITRTGDGRIIAKQDIRQQQNDVVGGAIGGFIVGSIFHRRVAGTIIGTMIGVAAADSDRAKDANVVVNAGDKVGALINQSVTIDFRPGVPPVAPPPLGTDGPARVDQAPPAISRYDPAYRNNINLTFRNKDLFFPEDARPYWVGKDVMVPLDPTAGQLFLDVDRRRDRTVYIDGPDSNIRLTISSRQARLDCKRYEISRTVVERKGVLYVPLDALVPLLKEDLLLNGTKFVVN